MARLTPSDLRRISSAASERKRQAQFEAKLQTSANKQAAREIAAKSRQAHREQDNLRCWILEAALSSRNEIEIENLTTAQLDFLAEKASDHVLTYGCKSAGEYHPFDAETLRALVEETEEHINQLQDHLDSDLFEIGEDVNAWVDENTVTAFEISLEPWFGEELNVYWGFDEILARDLLNHVARQIARSKQPGKVQVLAALKGLVEKQLLVHRKYTTEIDALADKLKSYQSGLDGLHDQVTPDEAGTDLVYWVSWKSLDSMPPDFGDPYISLLRWVNDFRGRASLKLIDSALLRKASAGEETAEFTFVEKDPDNNGNDTASNMKYCCRLDDRVVLPNSPSADMFCLLMKAMGYKARAKKQNDVWRVTISW